jgi:hypothetical protein
MLTLHGAKRTLRAGVRRARTRRGAPLVACAFMLSAGVGWGSTDAVAALFTASVSVPNNLLVAGSVAISTSPTSGSLSVAAMSPGDTITAPITVSNTGLQQLRYAATSTTSEDALAGQLDLYVKAGVTTCTTAGFSGSGSTLYNNTSHLGSTTTVKLFGDVASGSQSGDRVLNAGASETLCVQVSMPASIAMAYQGVSDTVSLAFQGEQTANN